MIGMHAIRKKLQSQRGASITFALLLFLVCAVIGSVVLTAGTVAAGRMSQVAEMDQRYYSVNSAANLIIDLLTNDDAVVRVVKTTEGAATPTTVYYKKDSTTPVGDASSFVIDTAKQVIKKYEDRESAASGGGGAATPTTADSPRAISITSDLSGATVTAANMKVAVEETVYDDGGLLFKISNVVEDGAKNNGKYTLYVRFQTDKDELRELDNENNKETVTTTLKWKLGDVQILRKTATNPSPTSTPGAGGD